jgi:hypothetical protein
MYRTKNGSSSASKILVFIAISSHHQTNLKIEKIQVRARHTLSANELRLLKGMNPPVPEVTVLIHRITKDRRAGEYAHQESLGVQALGQTAAETQTVILPRFSCELCGHPLAISS